MFSGALVLSEMASLVSVKKQVVSYGMFYAELEDFFTKELREQGFAGLDVIRYSSGGYGITVHVNNFKDVLGPNGVRAAILTRLIAARWDIPENKIRFSVKKLDNRGLSAITQVESLRFRLAQGIPARRAISGIMRLVMSTPGALGIEVTVSGKLRAQRAKTQKYRSGYLLRTGEPAKDFVDVAKCNILLRPGVLGLKVKIMRDTSKSGKPQPDHIVVMECKDEAALPARAPFVAAEEPRPRETGAPQARGAGVRRAPFGARRDDGERTGGDRPRRTDAFGARRDDGERRPRREGERSDRPERGERRERAAPDRPRRTASFGPRRDA